MYSGSTFLDIFITFNLSLLIHIHQLLSAFSNIFITSIRVSSFLYQQHDVAVYLIVLINSAPVIKSQTLIRLHWSLLALGVPLRFVPFITHKNYPRILCPCTQRRIYIYTSAVFQITW